MKLHTKRSAESRSSFLAQRCSRYYAEQITKPQGARDPKYTDSEAQAGEWLVLICLSGHLTLIEVPYTWLTLRRLLTVLRKTDAPTGDSEQSSRRTMRQ